VLFNIIYDGLRMVMLGRQLRILWSNSDDVTVTVIVKVKVQLKVKVSEM
jgi:hypothetical protein